MSRWLLRLVLAAAVLSSLPAMGRLWRRNMTANDLEQLLVRDNTRTVYRFPCGVDSGILPATTRTVLRRSEREAVAACDLRNLGTAYMASGDLQDAERVLRRSWELRPDDPVIVLRLVQIDMATGRSDQAGSLLGRYSWATVAPLMYEGSRRLMQRRVADSYACFDLAAALRPLDPAVLTDRARLLMELGKNAEAVDVLSSAIRICPRCAEAFLFRALARTNSGGDAAMAERDFRTAVALDSTSYDALHGLAAWLGSRGRTAEAVRTLRRMVELYPNAPEPRQNLWSLHEKP